MNRLANAILAATARIAAANLVCASLLAQPGFFRKDIAIGHQPGLAAVGDFNGDSRPDLAIATTDGLSVLLNEGGGKFGSPVRTEGAGHGYVAADFNGDGKLDLAGRILEDGTTGRPLGLAVLFGRGDGTFLPPQVAVEGTNICIGHAGDFNVDGKPDLVAYQCAGWGGLSNLVGLQVLLGQGDGSFSPSAVWREAPPDPDSDYPLIAVHTADFNNDGKGDLAAIWTAGSGSEMWIFRGLGNGAFDSPVKTPVAESWNGTVVADFNGDGAPDVATRTSIRLGNGDGTFQSPLRYPFSDEVYIYALAAADFDKDGKPDLAALDVTDNRPSRFSVIVYRGNGDGTLKEPVEYALLQQGPWTAVGDLDEDGRPDLVTTNSLFNTVSLLMYRDQGGPALRRAVSAASGTAIVAPGSLATLHARTPVETPEGADPPWPSSLKGIGLEVTDSNGATRRAPLLYVSRTQINFQVPVETALGEAMLSIAGEAVSSLAGSMQVEAAAPALFLVPGVLFSPPRPASVAVRVESDGRQSPVPLYECFEGSRGLACGPSSAGDPLAGGQAVYVSLFGTGFGNATTATVTASEDGMPVPIEYAGPQVTPGLDQINIRMTQELRGGTGLYLIINGVPANPVWLW